MFKENSEECLKTIKNNECLLFKNTLCKLNHYICEALTKPYLLEN